MPKNKQRATLEDHVDNSWRQLRANQTVYSGKLNLRMSSSLHEHLVAGAAREGVSLNAWIIALLAGASGFKQP